MEPCTFSLLGWLVTVVHYARARCVMGSRERGGEGGPAFLAQFLFSFRAGLWLFDSSLGFHSPLCDALRPANPKSLTSLFILLRSSSLRSGSFHLTSFQSVSILFALLSPFPGLFSLHELPGDGLPCKSTCPELSSPTTCPSRSSSPRLRTFGSAFHSSTPGKPLRFRAPTSADFFQSTVFAPSPKQPRSALLRQQSCFSPTH